MKYRYKTKPYQHQVKALKKMLRSGWGGALLMEPRTGKTKVAIDYLSVLATAGKIDRAIVIAPARVLDVWVEQLYLHSPVRFHTIVWDKDARKGALPSPSPVHDLTLLLVNYEAFGTPGKKLASGRRSKRTGRFANRQALVKWLQGKPAACILDESHRIKSPSGRASRMIVGLSSIFEYRLILTGTPITKANRIFDIYMQWKFLNPKRFHDLPTADEFKNYFGKWTNRFGFPKFLAPRNMDELNERMAEDAFFAKREDCLDLPPEMPPILRGIELDQKSGEAYDKLAEEMVTTILEGEKEHLLEASIPLVLALRLTQITGGYAKTNGGDVIEVGQEKLRVLEGIFEEACENEDKLVVAARFRPELDAIEALAARKGLASYSVRGGITRAESTANVRGFREASGAAVLIMNPQAGGEGIDLSTASHMVWYSLPTSWVNYKQAKDRIALSEKSITYTYLLAKHTVDEVIYGTLLRDGDVGQAILKDPRKVLRK